MIHRLVILLALPLIANCAGSFSDYSSADYHYQVTATILTVADWNQTLQFKEKGIQEQGTLMGDHPSDGRINTLVPLAIAGQWLASWALPVEAEIFDFKYNPRRVFQIGVIGGEGWAFNHNYGIGVRVRL